MAIFNSYVSLPDGIFHSTPMNLRAFLSTPLRPSIVLGSVASAAGSAWRRNTSGRRPGRSRAIRRLAQRGRALVQGVFSHP